MCAWHVPAATAVPKYDHQSDNYPTLFAPRHDTILSRQVLAATGCRWLYWLPPLLQYSPIQVTDNLGGKPMTRSTWIMQFIFAIV